MEDVYPPVLQPDGEAPKRRRRKKKTSGDDGATETVKQRVFDGPHNRFEGAKETFQTVEVKKKRRKKRPEGENSKDVGQVHAPVDQHHPAAASAGNAQSGDPVVHDRIARTPPGAGLTVDTTSGVQNNGNASRGDVDGPTTPGGSKRAPVFRPEAAPQTSPSPLKMHQAPTPDPATSSAYPTDGESKKERINAVLQEMQDKQQMIQHAMEKLSELKDAKRRCESERAELRALNQQLAVQNNDLKQKHPLIIDPDNDIAATVDDISSMPRVELMRRFEDLYRKYCLEAQRNQSINEAIMRMQNELITRNEEEKQLLQLQEAHMAAQHKLQELQEVSAKVGKYRATVKNQQQIISKLDSIIATKLNGGAKGRELMQRLQRLRKTNEELRGSVDIEDPECELLRREIRSLQAKLDDLHQGLPINDHTTGTSQASQALEMELLKLTEDNNAMSREIEQLRRQIAQAHQEQTAPPNPYNRNQAPDPRLTEIQQLQLKAETLEAEVADLTKELEDNALKNAQEIKMWKVKFAELQAGLNGGFGEELARTRTGAQVPVASRPAPTLHHTGQVRRPGSGGLQPLGSR
eukprot:TRINITY_DN10226_c0_g1_i3.p1 TRINITY_DN10226_c0_g1~~TRINITY_DN10226_c0_g1_i3.p1  ORF type:complete len:579 (-),score=119.48 TRINITY_DN10226_c0_g1_i3:186-1922(-)